MTKTKLAALAVVGVGLCAGSLVSAQYYNQYGYQYPSPQPYAYEYPQYPSACPNLYTNLTLGSSGQQVIELQRFLATRYYQQITGYYGRQTAGNVAQFQRASGILATGGVGPQTRAAILRSCGGYPGPYPTPTPSNQTFRLDRAFTLDEGESAMEYRGSLTVRLDRVGEPYSWYSSRDDDTVRVTLSFSCRPGTYCIYAPTQSYTLEEDDSVEFMGYEVEVTDIGSNRATFRVTDDDRDDDDDARITVTDPAVGEDFEQGDEMRIAWTVQDEPRDASVILDLYTENDRLVGTIAIEDGETGDFEWDVPERGEFCTAQYPNGLCGRDLEGDYYIKARLVAGNGFTNGFEYDEDDSGVFTIED
jgi:hypothetical protein